MSKGMWYGAIGGFAEGVQRAAPMLTQAFMAAQAAEIRAARDERLAEARRGELVFADELRRAPYQRAAKKANEYIGTTTRFDEDAAGNVTRNDPSRADQAAARARAYDEEGLPDAGSRFRTESLTAERLGIERESIARRDRQDERQHGERMATLEKQLNVQERALARQYALDSKQSTALTTNVKFMVDNGIAKDPADAFSMLRTRMERSPDETLEQITLRLLGSGEPRYRGTEGRQRAIDDARDLIGKIRSTGEDDFERGFGNAAPLGARRRNPAASSFTSAEDVRAAYRAKRIDRATAVRELQRFGYE